MQVRVEKVSFSLLSLFPAFFPPHSILHHSPLSECLERAYTNVPVVGLSWKSRPGLAVSNIRTILLKPQYMQLPSRLNDKQFAATTSSWGIKMFKNRGLDLQIY